MGAPFHDYPEVDARCEDVVENLRDRGAVARRCDVAQKGNRGESFPLTTTRRVLIKKTVALPRDASIRQEHRSDY